MKMAEIDIRDAQINVIRFADSPEILNKADVICKLTPGAITLKRTGKEWFCLLHMM